MSPGQQLCSKNSENWEAIARAVLALSQRRFQQPVHQKVAFIPAVKCVMDLNRWLKTKTLHLPSFLPILKKTWGNSFFIYSSKFTDCSVYDKSQVPRLQVKCDLWVIQTYFIVNSLGTWIFAILSILHVLLTERLGNTNFRWGSEVFVEPATW